MLSRRGRLDIVCRHCRKIRQERDKRIRPEGQKQYVEAADDFAEYYEADPYSPAW